MGLRGGRGRGRRPIRAEAPLRKPGPELYAALIAGLFAAVALARLDLVLEAWRVTAAILARGGTARLLLLGEIALFSGILYVTWRVIPSAPIRPAHDAAVFAIAAAFGWAIEAWGTRAGVWRYYTGEAPPLWIVPVWPLGAALVERLGVRRRIRAGRLAPGLYWMLSAFVFANVAWFIAPWLGRPAGWAGLAAVAACLAAGARPEEELAPLAVGMLCVFFADLWGVTNGCWAYYAPTAAWRGIAFGMALDAAVVVGALRLAGLLDKKA